MAIWKISKPSKHIYTRPLFKQESGNNYYVFQKKPVHLAIQRKGIAQVKVLHQLQQQLLLEVSLTLTIIVSTYVVTLFSFVLLLFLWETTRRKYGKYCSSREEITFSLIYQNIWFPTNPITMQGNGSFKRMVKIDFSEGDTLLRKYKLK